MSNSYYNPSGAPVTGSPGASSVMRGEFDLVASAFDLLPALTAGTAVVVNGGGSALTNTVGTLALAGNFATLGAFNTVFTQVASVTLTLPGSTGTLATLAGTETLTNKTLTAPTVASATLTGTLTNSGTISGGTITNATLSTVTLSNETLSGTTTLPGSGEISSAGYLGIGMTPANPLDITLAQNGGSYGAVLNAGSGAGAAAGWQAGNGTNAAQFGVTGASFTPSGPYAADMAYLQTGNAAGLLLNTTNATAAPIILAIKSTEVARVSVNGLLTLNGYAGTGALAGGQAYLGGGSTYGASLAGDGSTGDAALMNKSAAVALFIPTGTQNITIEGTLGVGGYESGTPAAGTGFLTADSVQGAVIEGQGSTYDATIRNHAGTVAAAVPTNTQNLTVIGFVGLNGFISGLINGKGLASASATYGAYLEGKGSTYDTSLLNDSGAVTLGVPTGTQNVEIKGNLTVDGTIANVAFTKSFTDTAQALPAAGATLTRAHGLGALPFGITAYLECVTANAGYSSGDMVYLPLAIQNEASTLYGVTAWADATNVNVVMNSAGNIGLFNKSTGTFVTITAADWNIVLRAWL